MKAVRIQRFGGPDEVAVEAFLERRIPFTGIPRTIERVLASIPEAHPTTIAGVLAADQEARQMARAFASLPEPETASRAVQA